MTSMTRLRRDVHRWARFADRATPGWRLPATREFYPPLAPPGYHRARLRHDTERLKRNLALWERARLEADRG